MCGIAGFCNISNSNFSIDLSLIEKMQKTLVHRGPDGYQIWSSENHGIAFVHRRLSIIDLSQDAFQPMMDENSTVVVCCNGEIYNYLQLRNELENFGYNFKTNSDTETIVYAYKKWGIDCLNHLDGMFAIVIFDKIKNELYIVRDRIGIKPIYFSLQSGVLGFASEIKALWKLPWISKNINRTALYHYLTFLVTPAPMTLYEGIYKLPASFYLKVDSNRNVTFNEWYTPVVDTYDSKKMSDEKFCIENIRLLLRESIKKRMMSDVPFGVFLSGGIDSSLNVALMSEFTDKVKTFNISFSDGPEYSEVGWARKVSKHFATEHHEIVITEKDAFDFFQRMVYHQDEPIGDCVCIPLYYVSKLLKDSGVTVVQAGEGSDELFCGYSLYAKYLNMRKTWNVTQKLIPKFARRCISDGFSYFFPNSLGRIEFAKNWAENRDMFWSGAVVFTEEFKRKTNFILGEKSFDFVVDQIYPGFGQQFDSHVLSQFHLQKLHKIDPKADFLKSMIYLELKQRLPELLLMRVDKMTMATSVECRVPFLDHKLVEFALQIPARLKYKKGVTKYILKKACEGILPNDVIYRKKMGFAAPTSRWFKNGGYFFTKLQDMLHSNSSWQQYMDLEVAKKMVSENQKANFEYSSHLWAVQNLMEYDAKQK